VSNDPRRGRPPRDVPATATGFRVTDAVRRELTLAQGFVGVHTLQAVLDLAVQHYLAHLHGTVAGFTEAVDAASAHVIGDTRNVTRLRGKRRS